LPEEGPGGVFPRGLRTEVASTGADGAAAVSGIVWNRLPGAFQIRVTALKGEVRAGTIVSQYISAAPLPNSGGTGVSRKKLIGFAAAIGAGAAAGIIVGMGRSAQTPNGGSAAPPPQIGMPTISIGRPQ
jgi:hypothetical protein